MVRAGEREETYEFMGITYWVDVTEYDDVKQEYLATRPVVMVMLVDNYDELMKPLTDRQRTELRGQLDIAIEKWCEGRGGILRRVDRDRYIFILKSGILTRSRKPLHARREHSFDRQSHRHPRHGEHRRRTRRREL